MGVRIRIRIRIRIRAKPTLHAVPAPISGSEPRPVMGAGRLASSANRTSRAPQDVQSTKAANPLQVPARRPGRRGGDACVPQLPRQMQQLLHLTIVIPALSRDRCTPVSRLKGASANVTCPCLVFRRASNTHPGSPVPARAALGRDDDGEVWCARGEVLEESREQMERRRAAGACAVRLGVLSRAAVIAVVSVYVRQRIQT